MGKLELVPTEELIEEISRRYDAFIFHGVSNRDNKRDTYYCEWHGGIANCLGLLEYARWKIRDELIDNEEL